MPPVNKKATTRAHSNVHTLNATPAKVLPPDGWVLEGPFGHMAFEAG